MTENDADGHRSFAAVEWSMSDRLIGVIATLSDQCMVGQCAFCLTVFGNALRL
jgi:hypothetical protein